MESLLLTAAEIRDLTQRQRPSAQARVLDALKLSYRKRPDGTLVVFRSAVGGAEEREEPRPQLRLTPRPALNLTVGMPKKRAP